MYSQHPRIAKRWSKETPKGVDLPEKVASLTDYYKYSQLQTNAQPNKQQLIKERGTYAVNGFNGPPLTTPSPSASPFN